MKKLALLMAVAGLIAGCSHPQPRVVFGSTGKQYSAPTLCQALVQCKQANESSCFVDRYTVTTASGTYESETCADYNKAK